MLSDIQRLVNISTPITLIQGVWIIRLFSNPAKMPLGPKGADYRGLTVLRLLSVLR